MSGIIDEGWMLDSYRPFGSEIEQMKRHAVVIRGSNENRCKPIPGILSIKLSDIPMVWICFRSLHALRHPMASVTYTRFTLIRLDFSCIQRYKWSEILPRTILLSKRLACGGVTHIEVAYEVGEKQCETAFSRLDELEVLTLPQYNTNSLPMKQTNMARCEFQPDSENLKRLS